MGSRRRWTWAGWIVRTASLGASVLPSTCRRADTCRAGVERQGLRRARVRGGKSGRARAAAFVKASKYLHRQRALWNSFALPTKTLLERPTWRIRRWRRFARTKGFRVSLGVSGRVCPPRAWLNSQERACTDVRKRFRWTRRNFLPVMVPWRSCVDGVMARNGDAHACTQANVSTRRRRGVTVHASSPHSRDFRPPTPFVLTKRDRL
jgi:hypothetical protein